jgi:predicted transcriptional regulator
MRLKNLYDMNEDFYDPYGAMSEELNNEVFDTINTEVSLSQTNHESISFTTLQEVFDTHLLLEDRGLVRVITGAFIGNQMKQDPVWLMIVGSSSGGKTETLMRFANVHKKGKPLCAIVSDISSAGLLSGQRGSEQEAILPRVDKNGGMLLFKDFTSIISKRKEDRAILLGQLREVYDGEFVRNLGNGVKKWKGKVGVIGASTGVIYSALQEMGAMGERLVMYQIKQPSRKKVMNFVWDREDTGKDGREEMDKAVRAYIENVFIYLEKEKPIVVLPQDVRERLSDIADFCTLARSPVLRNYKGDLIVEVPDPEMPMRTAKQLINIAKAFMVMNQYDNIGPILTPLDMSILFKIALDSIPNTYRDVLRTLTKYSYGGSLTAIAGEMSMPNETIRYRLQDLEARKLIKKEYSDKLRTDVYSIIPEYAQIMATFEEIHIEEKGIEEDVELLQEDNYQDWV